MREVRPGCEGKGILRTGRSGGQGPWPSREGVVRAVLGALKP